jgi:hypothetical protein
MISYLVAVHPQLSQNGFQMDGSLMGVGSHNPIVVGLKHLNVLLKSFVCSSGIVISNLVIGSIICKCY